MNSINFLNLFLISVLVAGCSSAPVKKYYSEKKENNEISIIETEWLSSLINLHPNSPTISPQIISIDGAPSKGHTGKAQVLPGKHEVILNCIMYYPSGHEFISENKTISITTKAGHSYQISGVQIASSDCKLEVSDDT